MPVIEPIRIEGLRDVQAALKAADGESQKQLRAVLNGAADGIVSTARGLVPRRSGRAAASLKASSSQREVRIKGGSARVPYYPWLDFGGRVGRNNSVSRPFMKSGRFIYAAYNRRKPSFLEALQDGLVKLARDAGFEVT